MDLDPRRRGSLRQRTPTAPVRRSVCHHAAHTGYVEIRQIDSFRASGTGLVLGVVGFGVSEMQAGGTVVTARKARLWIGGVQAGGTVVTARKARLWIGGVLAGLVLVFEMYIGGVLTAAWFGLLGLVLLVGLLFVAASI